MSWWRDCVSTQALADAKFYGNEEVYNILKSRGARLPVCSFFSFSSIYSWCLAKSGLIFLSCMQKRRKTPMSVTNPREVPEYELNPLEIHIRKADGISKACHQRNQYIDTLIPSESSLLKQNHCWGSMLLQTVIGSHVWLMIICAIISFLMPIILLP